MHDSVPDDNVFIENAVVRHAVVGTILHFDAASGRYLIFFSFLESWNLYSCNVKDLLFNKE